MQFISDQAICCILSSHILISFIAESHLYDKTDILLEWVNTNDKGCNSLSRYIKNCGYYHDFLHKGLLLTRKLLRQGLLVVKLKSSLRNNECRHHELVNRCGLSVSQMIMKMFRLSQSHSGHLSFMTFIGFETRVTRRVAHVQHPSSLSFFLICLSGFVLLLLSNWCFIPCCDLHYDFPIKGCSNHLHLRVVLCVVNEIRLSSHILASSTIFLSDDVRVAKKKHAGYIMWSRNTVIPLWVPEFTLDLS